MVKFLFLHSFLFSLEIKYYGTILICVLVKLLEFLLNLNSLPSDFSRPFFLPSCLRGKSFQLTLLLNFIDHI